MVDRLVSSNGERSVSNGGHTPGRQLVAGAQVRLPLRRPVVPARPDLQAVGRPPHRGLGRGRRPDRQRHLRDELDDGAGQLRGMSTTSRFPGSASRNGLGRSAGWRRRWRRAGAAKPTPRTELGIDVAGCFGHLDIWPDSEELDRPALGHHRATESGDPAPGGVPGHDPALVRLLDQLAPPAGRRPSSCTNCSTPPATTDDPQDKDVRHFLNALEAAVRWELPVHVSLAPLGHTDFGLYTVFPHCPRCKANAPVGRWQESYPTKPHECRVCGHTFNPDEHHSSERDEHRLGGRQAGEAVGRGRVRAVRQGVPPPPGLLRRDRPMRSSTTRTTARCSGASRRCGSGGTPRFGG